MKRNELANEPTQPTEVPFSSRRRPVASPSNGFRLKTKHWVSRLVAAFALFGLTVAAAQAGVLKSPYGLAADPVTGVVYIADPVAGGVLAYYPATGTISSFANVPDAFSLAVDSNHNVYVGIVGTNTRIEVYGPAGEFLNTLPVPPGDSPLTLAVDGANILYQANWANFEDVIGINVYNNDLLAPYSLAQFIPLVASSRSPTFTPNLNHSKFALAAEGGQVFVVLPSQGILGVNIFDSKVLASGSYQDHLKKLDRIFGLVPESRESWFNGHSFPVIGTAVAASFDAAHNLFYSDNQNGAIVATAKTGSATQLLTGLQAPYGIVFNKTNNKLYVAFPEEHLIRSYKVTYSSQNPTVPTVLALSKTIR